jgi:hypothetical protein
MHSRLGRSLFVSTLALLPAAAQAGSPLVCFPMAIGDARSLAWGSGSGWNTPSPDYDRSHLADDTLHLLGPQTPVLVRMETLRRAVIYASTDAAATGSLFAALRGRTAHPPSAEADPLADFDLGYAVATWHEARPLTDRLFSAGPTEDGYTLVRQALATLGSTPEMEYAAALMTRGRALRGISDKHLKLAVAGAREGSDLSRTLAAHQGLWGDKVQAYRATAAR